MNPQILQLDAVNEAFQALFYGDGVYLGLALYLVIFLAVAYKWRYAGALFFPVACVLGVEYLSRTLIWPSVIMWFGSFFIIIMSFTSKKKN